jgi:pimeloyl-ACP methyl ester carboxylesterase
VLGFAAVALASAAYQAAGEARDRRKYPPPGRLVDAAGHRLHIRCAGPGTPTVVVIPALGGSTLDWLTVQDRLASSVATCLYDRPGLGWSDPAAEWPSAMGMARELRGLLDVAGVAPPFVIAGHSMGGLAALMFTQLYRDEVAGLALVDSSHPEQGQRLPRHSRADFPGGKLAEVVQEFAWPLGLRRLIRSLRRQPPGDAEATLALSSRYRRVCAKELLAFDAVCRQTAPAARDLGDLPLAVITSSECAPGQLPDSRAQRARSRFYPAWAQLQDEFAALSANSVHVVAPSAGHHVQRDDPELVVRVITDLVLRVRQP